MKTLTTRIGRGFMAVILTGCAALALAAAASDEAAEVGGASHISPEPLMLRFIMQNLSTDMQRITGDLAREDWQRVAETALRVANHPQPPMDERLQIIRFLGTDAGIFKGYDQQVHAAALDLADAARREEGAAVISAFATIQTHCLSCHQAFRKSFKAHFYNQR